MVINDVQALIDGYKLNAKALFDQLAEVKCQCVVRQMF